MEFPVGFHDFSVDFPVVFLLSDLGGLGRRFGTLRGAPEQRLGAAGEALGENIDQGGLG